MKCKDYKNLLIQLPYNELSEEEAALLKDHLQHCEKCSSVLIKNKKLFELTERLSIPVPEDNEKQAALNSILYKIKQPKKLPSYQYINYRIIRIVINAAAVFLIGLFLFQQMEMKRNLESLNTKVQSHSYSLLKDHESIVMEITSNLKKPAFQKHLNISENQILELIENNKHLEEENDAILKYLQSNYPEVYDELQRQFMEKKSATRKL